MTLTLAFGSSFFDHVDVDVDVDVEVDIDVDVDVDMSTLGKQV